MVISLCADAAGEACPVYFGSVIRSHWGMPDPAKVQGDEAAIRDAFAETLAGLPRRITGPVQALAAQPGLDASPLENLLAGIARP